MLSLYFGRTAADRRSLRRHLSSKGRYAEDHDCGPALVVMFPPWDRRPLPQSIPARRLRKEDCGM